MDSAAAELSSVATALEELTRRVAAIGQHYLGAKRSDVASELLDIERALETASRRLTKTVETA